MNHRLKMKSFNKIVFLIVVISLMLQYGCRKKDNIKCNYNIHLPDTALKKALVTSRFFNSNGVEEYIDKDGDGEICDGEAIRPTELSICSSNIQSFEGIEHFTNLKQLNISGCNLDSLSISSSSISILHCYGNSLINLDVSNLKNLTELDCSENKLTMIDLSVNLRLKNLRCNNNKLTSINLSKNVNLEKLFCKHNYIDSLNINGLKNLELLLFRDNLISTIDLSNNLKLKSISFAGNPVYEIDFSNNPELNLVRFGDNPMTVLDISENNKIKFLDNYGEFPFDKICVWTLPFPPSGTTIQTLNFPDDFNGFEICE